LQAEIEMQRRQNTSLSVKVGGMRAMQDERDRLVGDNAALKAKVDKLRRSKSQADKDRERAWREQQDRSALDKLIRINTLVTAGTAQQTLKGDGNMTQSLYPEGFDGLSSLLTDSRTTSAHGSGGKYASGYASGSASASASGKKSLSFNPALGIIPPGVDLAQYYRGNHPGASKFMRVIARIPEAPGMLDCQRDDIVYINYGEKDAPAHMVHAMSYNGKRMGLVPIDLLQPMENTYELAHGFTLRQKGFSFKDDNDQPDAGTDLYPATATHAANLPRSPTSPNGVGTVTRLGEHYDDRIVQQPMGSASKVKSTPDHRTAGLSRDRVNATVSFHNPEYRSSPSPSANNAQPESRTKFGCCCCWCPK
jgi:hypothetical protein